MTHYMQYRHARCARKIQRPGVAFEGLDVSPVSNLLVLGSCKGKPWPRTYPQCRPLSVDEREAPPPQLLFLPQQSASSDLARMACSRRLMMRPARSSPLPLRGGHRLSRRMTRTLRTAGQGKSRRTRKAVRPGSPVDFIEQNN